MACYSTRRHVFSCIFPFSVVCHCVTATLVRHGLHMLCHFTVLYKLDGDVSQTRADSSMLQMLFTFIHYNLVFQFASSAVVSWWGCHIVVAFGAFFAPPLLKMII